jgi:hypothetical protein
MKLNKLLMILAVLSASLLAACGGTGGASLGAFPALTKTMGDSAFTITPPTSDSPGSFSYTSSNTAVATISGNTVTIVSAGTSTLTATQAATGKWGSGSISALLTVNARACILPATLTNGVCTALTLPGNFVTFGGRVWMPVSLIATWASANDFCTNTTINAQTGWRLPDDFELSELYKNNTLAGQSWTLGDTWTSKAGTVTTSRKTVDLRTGIASEKLETGSAYFTCIK